MGAPINWLRVFVEGVVIVASPSVRGGGPSNERLLQTWVAGSYASLVSSVGSSSCPNA